MQTATGSRWHITCSELRVMYSGSGVYRYTSRKFSQFTNGFPAVHKSLSFSWCVARYWLLSMLKMSAVFYISRHVNRRLNKAHGRGAPGSIFYFKGTRNIFFFDWELEGTSDNFPSILRAEVSSIFLRSRKIEETSASRRLSLFGNKGWEKTKFLKGP